MAIDIRNSRVRVDIACNDPDNGCFAGVAQSIDIGAQFIELEARSWDRPPRFVETATGYRLAGKNWPVRSTKYSVGNWCWNGYWMDIPVVVDFLCWLHGRGLFSLSCGESRIFNRWRSPRPFDDGDRAFLDRLLGKPSTHSFSAPALPTGSG